MSISCILSFPRKSERFVENRDFFHTPPAFDAHVTGLRRNIATRFGTEKTRMVWIAVKKFENNVLLVSTQCTNVTNRLADGYRTAAQAALIQASRGKNQCQYKQ